MSSIHIDPDAIRGFVEKAILDGITPEQKHDIVAQAVAQLLEQQANPSPYSGRRNQSMLQDAFTVAIRSAATTVVRELVENDPQVQARIREMVSAPIAEIAHGNYDGLPEKIGEAVGAGVAEWLRDR